jgi:hypothetical protein
VGNDPYDLCREHLAALRMSEFADFPAFRVHFQNTVHALNACSPAECTLPGFVVVDTLRTALGGNDYADALLRDPDTGSRVVSFSRAMTLLDIKHAALEIRGKHYLKRAATSDTRSAQKFTDSHFGDRGKAVGPMTKKPRQESVARAVPAATAPFGARPQQQRKAERHSESDEDMATRYAGMYADVPGVTYDSLLDRIRAGHCSLCGSKDKDHARHYSRHCPVFRRWRDAQGSKN